VPGEQFATVSKNRHHAKTEKIDLDDAKVRTIIFVRLDNRHQVAVSVTQNIIRSLLEIARRILAGWRLGFFENRSKSIFRPCEPLHRRESNAIGKDAAERRGA
jgi:hypothetical protein